jgi:hypothetical protein
MHTESDSDLFAPTFNKKFDFELVETTAAVRIRVFVSGGPSDEDGVRMTPHSTALIPALAFLSGNEQSHWWELGSPKGEVQTARICPRDDPAMASAGFGALQLHSALDVESHPYSTADELPEVVMGHLTVTVSRGREIPRVRQGGIGSGKMWTEPSPYAFVSYEASGVSFQFKTKVVPNSRKPEWNESFKIPFTALRNGCNVKIYNEDPIKPRLFGSITVSLQELYSEMEKTDQMQGKVYRIVNNCNLHQDTDPASATAGTLYYDELITMHQTSFLPDGSRRGFCSCKRGKRDIRGWISIKPHLLQPEDPKDVELPPMTTEQWFTLFGRSEFGKLENNGSIKIRIMMQLVDGTMDPRSTPRRKMQTTTQLRHALNTAKSLRSVVCQDNYSRLGVRPDALPPAVSNQSITIASEASLSLPEGAFQLCVHLGGCRNIPNTRDFLGEAEEVGVSIRLTLSNSLEQERLSDEIAAGPDGACDFCDELLYTYVLSLAQTLQVEVLVDGVSAAEPLLFDVDKVPGFWGPTKERYHFGRNWHALKKRVDAQQRKSTFNALHAMGSTGPIEIELEISAAPVSLQIPPITIPVRVLEVDHGLKYGPASSPTSSLRSTRSSSPGPRDSTDRHEVESVEDMRIFYDSIDLNKFDELEQLLATAKQDWSDTKEYELPSDEVEAVTMEVFAGLVGASDVPRKQKRAYEITPHWEELHHTELERLHRWRKEPYWQFKHLEKYWKESTDKAIEYAVWLGTFFQRFYVRSAAEAKFNEIDVDGSGQLEGEEIEVLLDWIFQSLTKSDGTHLSTLDRAAEGHHFRRRLDPDGDGQISFDELHSYIFSVVCWIDKLHQKQLANEQRALEAAVCMIQEMYRGRLRRKCFTALLVDSLPAHVKSAAIWAGRLPADDAQNVRLHKLFGRFGEIVVTAAKRQDADSEHERGWGLISFLEVYSANAALEVQKIEEVGKAREESLKELRNSPVFLKSLDPVVSSADMAVTVRHVDFERLRTNTDNMLSLVDIWRMAPIAMAYGALNISQERLHGAFSHCGGCHIHFGPKMFDCDWALVSFDSQHGLDVALSSQVVIDGRIIRVVRARFDLIADSKRASAQPLVGGGKAGGATMSQKLLELKRAEDEVTKRETPEQMAARLNRLYTQRAMNVERIIWAEGRRCDRSGANPHYFVSFHGRYKKPCWMPREVLMADNITLGMVYEFEDSELDMRIQTMAAGENPH